MPFRSDGIVEGQHFVYLYNNYIEKSFITALRVAFGHDATPDRYRYNKDINLSQVDIRSDFPQRITKLPIIIVTVGGGVADISYVGDEFLRTATIEQDGVEGYIYGGRLNLSVGIEILAGTKRDIEHLSDLVILYVRYLFRQKFFEKNIAYTKISQDGISQEENVQGSVRSAFKNAIRTTTYSEFTHFIDKDLYDTVQDIDFEIGTYFGGE